jgi:Predicted acetyltransferase involved in intracellular survival and related acetyltransferases
MSEIVITNQTEETNVTWFGVSAVDESGNTLSNGSFRLCDSRFGNGYIKAFTAGGVGTPVEHRRGGNVKKMFYEMLKKGKECGAAVSLLHPFSFSYYRMFGYEKVSDHLILCFPTRLLDFIPRRCSLQKLEHESQLAHLCDIYNKFSQGRNLMIARYNPNFYSLKNQTYIYYENGNPSAYITYSTQNRFIVNHMGESLLTVEEIAFTSPSGLREILSFLRMFEGEMDEIEISNCAMIPEIDLLLRHYMHTSYTVVPDIMARVLNIPAVLSAQEYPRENGEFTVHVDDIFDIEMGTYSVKYGGGKCEVKQLEFDAEADLSLSMQAFTRLIYGYDGIDEKTAAYIDGAVIYRNCSDFFRAFPKKPCGVFEHF